MNLQYHTFQTPIGRLYIVAHEKALTACLFENELDLLKVDLKSLPKKENEVIKNAKNQLKDYFLGQRKKFKLPLEFKGTSFQVAVWNSLTEISYGELQSYGEQAKAIKRKNAVRAVAGTNAKNLINIIVPCHRVIGKDGRLVGYRGGLKAKEFLLTHEGHHIQQGKIVT